MNDCRYVVFGLILSSVHSVSLVGGELAPNERGSPRGLFQISIDGKNLTEISPKSDLCYGSARYSYKGDKITFDAWAKDEHFSTSHVFIANFDGSALKQLSKGALPSWSPDDKQIAFRTYATSDGSNIVVINSDGSGRENLPISANCPRWSPNGRYIAFQSNRLGFFDAAKATKSFVPKRFTGQPRWGGDWSADGKYFCLPCVFSARQELVVMDIGKPFAVTNARTLHQAPEIGCNVDWSPDGKQILFFQRKNENERFQIYTIATDKKSMPRLVPGQPKDRNNTDPTWSPDGKTIMFCSGTP